MPYAPCNFSYVFNKLTQAYDPKRGFKSYRLSQIRNAANKVLLYENGDCPGLNAQPVVYDPISYKEPAHLFIALRHHNRSNVFSADGHVELFDSLSLKDETVSKISDNAVYVRYFLISSE